jgi:hypothetical protein
MRNTVKTTKNYDLFSRVTGNRKVNDLHVKRLQRSIAEQDLMIPIIVNNKLEVIDGQHRLKARQNLGYPIYYIVMDNMGLPETQRANANFKNWTFEDFTEAYTEQNYYHYKVYKQFRNKYQFGHRETVTLLSGVVNREEESKEFKEGNFCVKDESKATEIAEKIYQIKPYYKGFKRRSFTNAMLICFKHEQYNHEDFLQKLSYQSTKLVDCGTTKQYLQLIEEIYNFKRKTEDKIRFL